MPITTIKGIYSGGTCALVENGLMCGTRILAKGMCGKHYARVRRHGSPFSVTKNMDSPEAWIWYYLEPQDNGCRYFIGQINRDGYGVFGRDRTTVMAHRWLWEHKNGPIPDGMTLDHECHNEAAARGECAGGPSCLHRRCTEVDHMAVKPRGENTLASPHNNVHKTHCKRGHEFSEANTYIAADGHRGCRECRRIYERDRNHQRRLAAERKAAANGE